MICACGKPFSPHRNAKTCSTACSADRTARRQRDYWASHPEARAFAQLRRREVAEKIAAKRLNTKLDRAVKILFNHSGEHHERTSQAGRTG